jgi:bifunctional non-homologous end joining protein LigD
MKPDPVMKLDPVIPFVPVLANRIPEGPGWTAQIKWDGVRMLAYFDGRELRLVNRRRHDRTAQYPEFHDPAAYCRAPSFILDGEFVAFDRRKPSFHEIMRRDSLRKPEQIRRAVAEIPVTYMVFDVLYCDGGWVTDRPLAERQRMLASILRPQPHVQPVENVADAEALLAVMKAHGMEGIVCKKLDSAYAIGGKDKRWQKLKIARDLLAVVGGVTFRDGIVNALLLGLYDPDGRLIYIGHAGTGKITADGWRRLTREAASLAVREMPFANRPERAKGAVWIRPVLVVNVRFLEWTAHGTLRQPSIQAFVDAPPEACTFAQAADGRVP